MDAVAEKAKKWIEAGKDPRSAYWQAALESVMSIFEPHLEPGRLIPIPPLAEADISIYQEVLQDIDLSPNVRAVFLPPAAADKIRAPESAAELQRIDEQEPSYKILASRPGEELRIICAEISDCAKKPGVDIFQAGALLGSYEFSDRSEFLSTLNQILRAHMWEKGKWRQSDYERYTVNWFERVLDTNLGTVPVDTEFSFFHSPTLIRSNRVDAIFMLIYETFCRQADNPDEAFERRVASILEISDPDARALQRNEMAQQSILRYLTVMKDCELVPFDSFTDKESRQFNQEFDRTLRKIVKKLT